VALYEIFPEEVSEHQTDLTHGRWLPSATVRAGRCAPTVGVHLVGHPVGGHELAEAGQDPKDRGGRRGTYLVRGMMVERDP